MTTVSGRVYSELPHQPSEIVEAFNLDKTVPAKFSSTYLEENVTDRRKIEQGAHDLDYKAFILDTRTRSKKLPRSTKSYTKLKSKDRRRLNIHNLASEDLKYTDFYQLHLLWLEYMKEVLAYDGPKFNPENKAMHESIVRCDLHGCKLRVVQSKCLPYIGHKGIVIQETKETFRIINKLNQVKTITKRNTIFAYHLGQYEFKIYGNNFIYRPADRINKKFKVKSSLYLQ